MSLLVLINNYFVSESHCISDFVVESPVCIMSLSSSLLVAKPWKNFCDKSNMNLVFVYGIWALSKNLVFGIWVFVFFLYGLCIWVQMIPNYMVFGQLIGLLFGIAGDIDVLNHTTTNLKFQIEFEIQEFEKVFFFQKSWIFVIKMSSSTVIKTEWLKLYHISQWL